MPRSASRDYVNVMAPAYGAKGDGVADDTAAVAAAYTAAAQQGRPLYFPPGVYKLTSLPAFATGTTVLGAGADQTTLLHEGSGTLLALRNVQLVHPAGARPSPPAPPTAAPGASRSPTPAP